MKNSTSWSYHEPVLLNEVISALEIKKDRWYIDATAGGGGHCQEVLNHGGKVLGLDWDDTAIKILEQRFLQEIKTNRFKFVRGNYKDLASIVKSAGIRNVAGIIFDLGMSSFQILESNRGFSFKGDEKLDMRMDNRNKLTAAILINSYSENDLYEIFTVFGEERLSREIARALVRARSLEPLDTTSKLVAVIEQIYRKTHNYKRIRPATKVFQALRIAVNNELMNLKGVLPQVINVLARGGRCIVISFHSLEDRIVKNFYLNCERHQEALIVNRKPITATTREIQRNPAARSAKMRIIQKL